MKLFVTICDDARLLIHLLRHYEEAGIDDFYIAVPSELVPEVKIFADTYKITVAEGLNVFDSMRGGTSAVSEMRRRFQRADEWIVIVDLDEFIDFAVPIDQLLQLAEIEGANVVRGIMYDRFSADGGLPEIKPGSRLPELFPVKSRFTRDVRQGADWKGVLVKGLRDSVPGWGHHLFKDERVCSLQLEISHYRWNQGTIERMEQVYRELTDAGVDWADEYKRVLDHYRQCNRFRWQEFGGVLTGRAQSVDGVRKI